MATVIFGGHGMLGTDVAEALPGQVERPRSADVDITDVNAVRGAVVGANLVINAAAYTRVDDAEDDESAAFEVNAIGARNVAAAAAELGARVVHISTDYVFDGAATEPYAEDAPRHPIGAYGRTKAAGEQMVAAAHPGAYIVRTSWLYGAHGPNFPRAILGRARTGAEVSVVTDQTGQPTWSVDVAHAIRRLMESEAAPGIYHATNAGAATWFEFAHAVFAEAGLDPTHLVATNSAAFVRRAPRPAYSVLGHSAWRRAGLEPLRPWRAALEAAADAGVLDPE